ncbi:hypothetical protein ACFPM3_20670 [Streptomyces coeruleoprunus]|uniref:Uncharacterized protein n=1 Tax=Streptomyces coeruleoprunus TaxID=285563 RepID=A0ABV9XGR4_9ACTN
MKWADEEYCLYVNASEGSTLWQILADWTQSEDEELWKQHIPLFSRLIVQWHRWGFLKVRQGAEWMAAALGDEVPADRLEAVLGDPANWEYDENPKVYTFVTVGDRDIVELKDERGEIPE